MAAIYQRHNFLAERKEALERWGRHVTGIIAERVALRANPDLLVVRANQNTELVCHDKYTRLEAPSSHGRTRRIATAA